MSGEPEELFFLLWAAQGAWEIVERQGQTHAMRTVPSAGARHPFETYEMAFRAILALLFVAVTCRLRNVQPGSGPEGQAGQATMADIFKEALGHLSGGRVLDLATGEGGFVELLAQNLKDHGAIVGADADGLAVEAAGGRFDRGEISFVQMEGERLGFATACFDMVAISASLHHLADIPPVLAEVGRVLKPGGYFVLAEMHRDGQTAAQRTLIAMHHWIADVASALGMVHNRTLSRQELVDHAQGLGLRDVACYDTALPQEDPLEESAIHELKDAIDRTLQQAAEAPNPERLRRRGESLRERLLQVGAQWEPVAVIVGRKA